MKKGQFTIEFVVVLALFLTALATVSIPLYNRARGTAGQTTATMEAREAANALAHGINSVYSGGVGTSQPAKYWLPEEVTGIEEKSVDNELVVSLRLDLDKVEEVQVDTLLPGHWTDRIDLNKIEIRENRSYHETLFRSMENRESSGREFVISISDKIKAVK